MVLHRQTHVTVSVPTLAVCLMLTEREREHEYSDCVWGVCDCAYACGKGEEVGVRGQEEDDTNAKGKAAIKAQSAHPLPPISVRGV